jgi:hypothetical protein
MLCSVLKLLMRCLWLHALGTLTAYQYVAADIVRAAICMQGHAAGWR